MTEVHVLAVVVMLFALGVAFLSMSGRLALSPLALFVGASIVFINIGFVGLSAGHAHADWASTAVLATSVGLLMVCVGWFVGISTRSRRSAWPPRVQQGAQDLPYGIAITTALVVFGTVALYFWLVGYVPMYTALEKLASDGYSQGILNTPRIMRDVYVNPRARYIPLQGFMEMMRYCGLPVIAVWFLHFYRCRTRPKTSLAMLVLSALLIVSTGQRWPLMYMMVTLATYWSWTSSAAALRRKGLLRILWVSVALAVVLTVLLARQPVEKDVGYLGLVESGSVELWDRILYGNARVPFASYAIYGHTRPFLYGQSWLQNLVSLLPGPAPSFPVTFNTVVRRTHLGSTAPPDFYTEAYVNFSWPGVVMVSFIWGVVLAHFQGSVCGREPGLFRVSVLSLMTTMLAFTSISGVTMVFNGLIVVVSLYAVIEAQRLLRRT